MSKSQRGAVMVESSVAAFLFFSLLLLGAETVLVSYKVVSAQFVLAKVARWGVSGETLKQGNPLQLIKNKIVSEGHAMGVQIDQNAISICPAGSASCSGPDDLGGQGSNELLLMQINYPLTLVFKRISLSFRASALMRKEPV